MKKIRTRLMLLLLVACLTLVPALSMAMEEDVSGNAIASEGESNGKTVRLDLMGAGENVSVINTTVGESALLAGKSIQVSGSNIGGSLRAAGYDLEMSDTAVAVNMTVAGYSIDVGQGTSAKAVYAAAYSVTFAGECETLNVAASKVVLRGTVTGDANIVAEQVIVESGAKVGGVLHVEAAQEPVLPEGASIGSMQFTKTVQQTEETVKKAAPIWKLVKRLTGLTMMLPGGALLAVLFFFIIGGSLKDAVAMTKKRPVAMPVSGLITLISAPIAAILLLITYVGVPAGLLLGCLYALALAFSVSFAGCVFGQLVFPKLHGLLASIIGVAIFTVARVLPVVRGIVLLASMVYTLGYFIQKIYLGFGKRPVPTETVCAQEQIAPPAENSSGTSAE